MSINPVDSIPVYKWVMVKNSHFIFFPQSDNQSCLVNCMKQSYATWMPKRSCAQMGNGQIIACTTDVLASNSEFPATMITLHKLLQASHHWYLLFIRYHYIFPICKHQSFKKYIIVQKKVFNWWNSLIFIWQKFA